MGSVTILANDESRKSILVADDTASARELLCTILEQKGYVVFLAGDGVEILEIAWRMRPHLIVLALQMRGLDGFAVIRELRLDPNSARTPVLALDAVATPAARQRASREGFAGYVAKPVIPYLLRAEVERLVGAA